MGWHRLHHSPICNCPLAIACLNALRGISIVDDPSAVIVREGGRSSNPSPKFIARLLFTESPPARGRQPSSHTNCTEIPPSAPKSPCTVSPLAANTTRVNEPASTTCPGSSGVPIEPTLLASHATPIAG